MAQSSRMVRFRSFTRSRMAWLWARMIPAWRLALRRQVGRPLHLGGVAHDHGERGADVVGHAVDPVGPGGVPHLLGLPEPPAHHKIGQEQHTPQGQQEDAADPQGRVVQQSGTAMEMSCFHMLPLGDAHHQQAVVPDAALYRVVAGDTTG